MRILPEYLKYRIKILLLFLTAFAFPALTLSLYDLPTEPVLYAFALSGTVLAVSAVFDFVLFVRRHRLLSRILSSVDADGHIGASAAAEFAGGGSLPHHIRDL